MGSAKRRPRDRLTQKTYSHLLGRRRMPTDYELVTSELLYYPKRGFEIDVPLKPWYARYQQGSPLQCDDWERFEDPRRTTYATYVQLQNRREAFVDGLLESIDDSGHDTRLSADWIELLAHGFAPLRFPFHGLQMVAAYIGSMAPSGRIAVVAAFQAADEMRRIQRIAYRVRQLERRVPGFGADSRARWEQKPLWQPLRRAVEQLLVTWDWGEALVGLNLCLKPLVDAVTMSRFAALAVDHGDYPLGEMLRSLEEDCRWQRDWTRALVRVAVQQAPANRAVIEGWIRRWAPRAWQAVAGLAPLWGASFKDIDLQVWQGYLEMLRTMELPMSDDLLNTSEEP